jgi:hypothetical protein
LRGVEAAANACGIGGDARIDTPHLAGDIVEHLLGDRAVEGLAGELPGVHAKRTRASWALS